jgi:hypothetical protein
MRRAAQSDRNIVCKATACRPRLHGLIGCVVGIDRSPADDLVHSRRAGSRRRHRGRRTAPAHDGRGTPWSAYWRHHVRAPSRPAPPSRPRVASSLRTAAHSGPAILGNTWDPFFLRITLNAKLLPVLHATEVVAFPGDVWEWDYVTKGYLKVIGKTVARLRA